MRLWKQSRKQVYLELIWSCVGCRQASITASNNDFIWRPYGSCLPGTFAIFQTVCELDRTAYFAEIILWRAKANKSDLLANREVHAQKSEFIIIGKRKIKLGPTIWN